MSRQVCSLLSRTSRNSSWELTVHISPSSSSVIDAGSLNSTMMGVFKPQKLASPQAFPPLSFLFYISGEPADYCQKNQSAILEKRGNVYVLCALSTAFGKVPTWVVLVGNSG